MLYINYGLLVIGIVVVSIGLSNCMDKIDKKTEIGGALLGGVFLAIITSLPELFTSLTALFQLDKPQVVQGNVVGSNLFNIAIIALMSLVYIKKFVHYRYMKQQVIALSFCAIQCILVLFALFIKASIDVSFMSIHIVSILIIILYCFGVKSFQQVDDINVPSKPVKTSIYVLFIQFILLAIALVFISIQLTKVSDLVAISLGLNATLAGAIFLGIATSLPELTSAITLFKLNNMNAAIASLIGSCMFNFLILSISDFLYIKEVVYSYDYQTFVFLIFTLASLVYASLLLKFSSHRIYIIAFSTFLLGCYFLSVVLSL